MVAVIADMRLEQDRFSPAGYAAAIDEVLENVRDFSDVGVCRDVIVIGQNESRESIGMPFKKAL